MSQTVAQIVWSNEHASSVYIYKAPTLYIIYFITPLGSPMRSVVNIDNGPLDANFYWQLFVFIGYIMPYLFCCYDVTFHRRINQRTLRDVYNLNVQLILQSSNNDEQV